jgi:hypothetical protein
MSNVVHANTMCNVAKKSHLSLNQSPGTLLMNSTSMQEEPSNSTNNSIKKSIHSNINEM